MNVSAAGYNSFISGFNLNSALRPPVRSPDGTQQTSPPFNPVVNTKQAGANAGNAKNPDLSEKTSDTSRAGDSPPTRPGSETDTGGQALTRAEIQLLKKLKQVDAEIRRHEMAHIAAGGRYITSAANFTYKRGPDGRNYAVAGEVSIDTSPVPGDPQATIQKMRQVKRSALAPANPSAQDLKVASQATSAAAKAMAELMVLRAEEQAKTNESIAFGKMKNAADAYTRINNLPEDDTSTFEIAV